MIVWAVVATTVALRVSQYARGFGHRVADAQGQLGQRADADEDDGGETWIPGVAPGGL
jgi:hypothetical protein